MHKFVLCPATLCLAGLVAQASADTGALPDLPHVSSR
jgi:hypothetical protein